CCGRSGKGHPAVCCLDPSFAGGNGTGLESIYPQEIEAYRGPDNVNNRVDRADFMEMDLGEIYTVNPRLGLTQPHEDPLGKVLLFARQAALVNDCFDVVPVAMDVLVRSDDLRMCCAEACFSHGLKGDAPGKPKCRDRLLNRPRIHPSVDQGA